MTLLGWRAGTACWLTGVVDETLPGLDRRPPNCRKPALERLARDSLFDRYMKAQLRLDGGRRKLGRNGLSSDRPRGCLPPRISARPARPVFLGSPSPQDAQPTRCVRRRRHRGTAAQAGGRCRRTVREARHKVSQTDVMATWTISKEGVGFGSKSYY